MLVRITGLGPGDPSLLTIGALDALRAIGRAVALLAPPDLSGYLSGNGVRIERGLVDGVVKLETANQLVSSLRDVMIAAICVGAVVRLIVRREKVRLPPLSGWVIAFVVLVSVATRLYPTIIT